MYMSINAFWLISLAVQTIPEQTRPEQNEVLHQFFTTFSLLLHHFLISSSSALHQLFITYSSHLHQFFISSALPLLLVNRKNIDTGETSPNITPYLLRFGISIPKLVFPGWDDILAEIEDIALAMSSASPITLLAFIPALGINSYKVTIGPVL